MTTVILSFWRTDVKRDLEARARHLLEKKGRGIRFIWVVGDSQDETESYLRSIAPPTVMILRHDTGIVGEDRVTRLRRFSQTADAGLAAVALGDDDRVLIHESDLRSPRDVVARLGGADHEAVAGWPTLTIMGRVQFYDTYVYRAKGEPFMPYPPYHAVYQPRQRFAVDSVGSVWSLPAWAIRAGVRGGDYGALGICFGLREHGVRILVDPTVEVVQPFPLWTPAFAGLGNSGQVSPFLPMKTWQRVPT